MDWIQEGGVNIDSGLSHYRGKEDIAIARVLVAQGETNNALRLLESMLKAAEATHLMGQAIEILLLILINSGFPKSGAIDTLGWEWDHWQ